MEIAETIPPFAGRSRNHRSAISNGTKLFVLDGSDGRSATSRRFKDILDQIVAEMSDPSNRDLVRQEREASRRALGVRLLCLWDAQVDFCPPRNRHHLGTGGYLGDTATDHPELHR